MMKKTMEMKIFLHLVVLCITFIAFSSASFAEQLDPRWKWSYSTDRTGWYLDTKTIEYDAVNQNITVWVLSLNADGTRNDLYQQSISLKNKTSHLIQWTHYYKTGPRLMEKRIYPSAEIVRPDSPTEAVVRNIASLLGIAPLYKGGENRWTWLHSTNTYGLYIAKDTLLYHPDINKNSIWIKRVDLQGRERHYLVFFSFADGTVKTPRTGDYMRPIPESDEEYILNAAKSINV